MQAKNIYSYDDLTEVLAECAIGTETMKQIEEFIQMKERHEAVQRQRLREAAEYIGFQMIDELMYG